MILITLGTQDKSFIRLLKAVEDCCEKGLIQERVVVQSGHTLFSSKYMEVFDYIEYDKFDQLIDQADLVITHGGVGTIMSALRKGKRIIGVARLAQYKEHHNDHQKEILESFDEKGYLIYVRDLDQLEDALYLAQNFEPVKYESNTQKMIQQIREFIYQS